MSLRRLTSHWIYPALAAVALLAATVSTLVVVTREIDGFRAELRRAQAVKQELAQLAVSLNAAERDIRAAVIDGDTAALARFRDEQPETLRHMESLSATVKSDADRAPIAARLHDFVQNRQASLGSVVNALERGDAAGARSTLDNLPRLALITTARLEDPGIDAKRERDATRAIVLLFGLALLLFTAATAVLFMAFALARRGQSLAAMYEALQQQTETQRSQDALLREAREQLAQAQKMEALGHLTGTISHDFNNILAAVSGALNLAQRRLQRGEASAADMIEAARAAAERGAALTQRLLSFSRRRGLNMETVSADKALARVQDLALQSAGPGITVDMRLGCPGNHIAVDVSQFETAILNLVINACDAMAAGGTLTIMTAPARLDTAAAQRRGITPGDYILVTVADTGGGMPEDVAARVFEPFFTTKAHGTGLGLSQVYGFAKQSQGHVELNSLPGRGTTIRIYLPVAPAPAQQAPAAPTAPVDLPQARAGEAILVVDDDAMVREVSASTLVELGYRVLEAEDAATAIAALRASRVNLLFTDIVMPGMNGVELAAAAVREQPGLKVLFTSGYPRDALTRRTGEIAARAQLLRKPFSLENLAHAVRRTLDEGPDTADAPLTTLMAQENQDSSRRRAGSTAEDAPQP